MSPEAQHIALMESLGWRKESGFMEYDGAFLPWTVWVRNGEKVGNDKAPNFLNDLNAMHEAEKTLVNDHSCHAFWKYADMLAAIVDARLGRDAYIHATAAQRAEAFLRTKGLWADNG